MSTDLCLGEWPARLVGDAREPFIAIVPYDMAGEMVTITMEDTATPGTNKVTAAPCQVNVLSPDESQITWQATASDLDTAGAYRVYFDSTELGFEPRRIGYVRLVLVA